MGSLALGLFATVENYSVSRYIPSHYISVRRALRSVR